MDNSVLKQIWMQNNVLVDLILLTGCLSINTWLIGVRQKILLHFTGVKINILDSCKVVFIANIGSYLTPLVTGSFFAKIMLIPYYTGATKSKSLFVASYGFAFEIIWIAIISLILAVSILPGWIPLNDIKLIAVVSTGIIALSVFVSFFMDRICLKILNASRGLPAKLKRVFLNRGLTREKILGVAGKITEIVNNPRLFIGMSWPTLLHFIIIGFVIILTARLFEVNLNLIQSLMIYWIPNILGKLSGIPGGVGIQDVSMGFFLTNYGVDIVTATKIVAAYRLITLSYLFLFGGIIVLAEGRQFLQVLGKAKINSRKEMK